jgi:serine/threonine-protein kinase
MEDTAVGEQIILKFLNAHISADAETMQRFVHELKYSRKITHQNVIRIFDFIKIQGVFAISMEYFKSKELSDVIRGKPIDTKRAIKIAKDICEGMSAAHEVGIVHRDLKPANVLINDNDEVKVVDFGVAAAQSSGDTELTKTGFVIGSPKYMAPEQILGKKVDQRADVYAMGIIMYEMFTGTAPYTKGDHMAVMYQHVQGSAKKPHELNTDLNLDLSKVITKAMTVNRDDRYQSMQEIQDAISKFL